MHLYVLLILCIHILSFSFFLFFLLFLFLSSSHSCSVLEVIGEVQRPMLILSESFLHIETCYKNIPVTHTLTLLNTTLLHTQYQWINEEVRKGREREGEMEKERKIIVGDFTLNFLSFLFWFRGIMLIWYSLQIMAQLGHTRASV